MAMFKEAADIKTSDQLHLPVPDAKFETVVVKPSEIQQDMVQALSERAAEVHSGSVDPSVDNMLKITSDGRKIGLDQRLMNSALPDDPNSKLNACVNNVLRIWNDTKEQKLTQLIFCDMSTPKGDGSFNVYDDIRTKLLNAGVPDRVHPQRRYGEQESRTFLQGTQRTGACAAGQHCQNGGRDQRPDAARSGASSGCRLASV